MRDRVTGGGEEAGRLPPLPLFPELLRDTLSPKCGERLTGLEMGPKLASCSTFIQ